jgi:two-component system alkaline phosphatase synthesis response regulator PhoP
MPEGNITIDYREKIVSKDGELIKLPLKEFEMLALLVQNKNKVLSREELISRIWGSDLIYVDPRTIDVHIKNIRKVLDVISIQTVYGIGYRYCE